MKIAVIIFFCTIATAVYGYSAQHDHRTFGELIFHSGGTDKCGCHYNRKTGEYHCHTRKQRGGDCPP